MKANFFPTFPPARYEYIVAKKPSEVMETGKTSAAVLDVEQSFLNLLGEQGWFLHSIWQDRVVMVRVKTEKT